MPERRAPRVSDLKRALRWVRAQYQSRAEEATRGQDRMIERIRKTRADKTATKELCPSAQQDGPAPCSGSPKGDGVALQAMSEAGREHHRLPCVRIPVLRLVASFAA